MAETLADESPVPVQPESDQLYWCYSCYKRVAVELRADLGDVVCYECKNRFVESIAAPNTSYEFNLRRHVIQVFRLLDLGQIEMHEWDNDEQYDDEHSVEVVREEEGRRTENIRYFEEMRPLHRLNMYRFNLRHLASRDFATGEVEEEEDEGRTEVIGDDSDEEENQEMRLRNGNEILRLGLMSFLSHTARRREQIAYSTDVLRENHSIEHTLQVPDSDDYVGNPGDYLDASEYEDLLLNLAESDSGWRRGAPPAAQAAVEGLESVEIDKEENTIVCSICKDSINVGEIAKKLPCGHGHHDECIVPWLGTRNSCPVCRFELPTDDPEYEEERKKRAASSSSPSTTAAAAGASQDSTLE